MLCIKYHAAARIFWYLTLRELTPGHDRSDAHAPPDLSLIGRNPDILEKRNESFWMEPQPQVIG